MTYLMQARIEEFVHKVKLLMLILLSCQLEITEYSRDSVGWAPTSICLDWRVVWNEPSGCQGLREQDAGRNKRKGEDGELYTLNPTALGGGSRRFRLWHSSLHSNISRLGWKSKERLVQLAQSGQALKNINQYHRKKTFFCGHLRWWEDWKTWISTIEGRQTTVELICHNPTIFVIF